MPASVGYLVIDTTGPSLLVPFWCGLLDVQVGTTIGDGQFVLLTQTADGLTYDLAQLRDAPAHPAAVGEHDVPVRLLPPSRLAGRDDEVAALEAAFAPLWKSTYSMCLDASRCFLCWATRSKYSFEKTKP